MSDTPHPNSTGYFYKVFKQHYKEIQTNLFKKSLEERPIPRANSAVCKFDMEGHISSKPKDTPSTQSRSTGKAFAVLKLLNLKDT